MVAFGGCCLNRAPAAVCGEGGREVVHTARQGLGADGVTLTELAGEVISVTTFSVASTLLPVFELYQGVQLDFSSRTWVRVDGGEESMDAARESAVKRATRLVDAAPKDAHFDEGDETRWPGRGESAWLTRDTLLSWTQSKFACG